MPLKVCGNLGFLFKGESLIDSYHTARALGFRAVEVGNPYTSPVEVIKKNVENLGIEHVLINVPNGLVTKGELGFAAIPGKQEEYNEGLKKALSYAKGLGCSRIHVMSGCVENPSQENRALYKKNILDACRLFGDAGITALIEPINPWSVSNYYMQDYDEALQLIKSANSPYLKLQLDIFHLQHLKGNITRNIKELLPYVGHIQVAQIPSRNEPDTDGEVNYKYIFHLLEQEGYNGWIGLEYNPRASVGEGLKWVKEMGLTL